MFEGSDCMFWVKGQGVNAFGRLSTALPVVVIMLLYL